jgi:hypothetical protein
LAPATPTVEPTEFYAGDTVSWLRTVADYPAADGWTLKYQIKGTGSSAVAISDITATTDASGAYAVTIPASSTDDYTVGGKYRLFGWVVNGSSERHAVYDSWITIFPNVAAATAVQLQTQAESDLAAIDAAIEGRLSSDLQDYMVAGTQITKIPIEMLYRLRASARAQVWREQNRGKFAPTVQVSYGSALSDDSWVGA